MAALEQAQLDDLRRRLDEEHSDLDADIARTNSTDIQADKEYDPEFSSQSNHPAESATETFQQERGLAVEGMLQGQLAQVERAQARMKDGSYGRCEICGRDIPLERLQAKPSATLCIDDQARQEAQQHS